jgi:hypothetical protein
MKVSVRALNYLEEAQGRTTTLILSFYAISIFCSMKNCFALLGRQLFSVIDKGLTVVESRELAKVGEKKSQQWLRY